MNEMFVECLDNDKLVGHPDSKEKLTVGKKYEVVEQKGDMLRLINDDGKSEWYFDWRFVEVQ